MKESIKRMLQESKKKETSKDEDDEFREFATARSKKGGRNERADEFADMGAQHHEEGMRHLSMNNTDKAAAHFQAAHDCMAAAHIIGNRDFDHETAYEHHQRAILSSQDAWNHPHR
jgi:hypothetical protein